jgi:hypothetical protein
LDRGNVHHPSFVPEASVADGTAAVGMEATVEISQCNGDHLKVCILAASTSVWGVQDIFPSQLDVMFCLLHPTLPNHLAVIQQTGAGKTYILRMLGVINGGLFLFLSPS